MMEQKEPDIFSGGQQQLLTGWQPSPIHKYILEKDDNPSNNAAKLVLCLALRIKFMLRYAAPNGLW
jgi:hypothetical protein